MIQFTKIVLYIYFRKRTPAILSLYQEADSVSYLRKETKKIHTNVNSFHIKLIAIVTMVIDHVGLFFFPQVTILRYIGRIAFPLFAWLIANGAHHTHDIKKYLARLFVLATVSQAPFIIANLHIGSSLFYLNVVFTLFFGLLAIYGIKNTTNKFLWLLILFGCSALANILHSDYGAMGVLSIVSFYIFFNNKLAMLVSQIVLMAIIPWIVFTLEQLRKIDLSLIYINSLSEIYGIIALLCIFLYNKKEGLKTKNFLYIFYPLQYITIVIFQLLLHN